MISLISSRAPRAAALVVTSLCLAMITTACGSKGPVKPKLLSLPAAPDAVILQQQGGTLLLGWTMPEKNQDDSAAEDLVGFHIRRYVYPADENCPTCRKPKEQVAKIALDYPAPGQRIGKRFYWRDTEVTRDYGYRYAIVPVTLGREAGEPAHVHQVVQSPPPAPNNLQAEAGNRQIQLNWQAPSLPEGMELLGYNLYRRHDRNPFSLVPVNSQPLQETHLLDRGLTNGQAYEYRISTVVQSDQTLLESLGTPGVLITPQAGR